MGHRSGDLTGRVGRVAREESMDEVGWKEIRPLLDVPRMPGVWHNLRAC